MAFDLSQYETVDERLHKFWERYPDGRLETEVVEASNTRFIILCKLYRSKEDARPSSTGLAMEVISDRGVNANFALENGESSSIGRALANLGLSAKGKRNTRETMAAVNAAETKRIYSPPGSRAAAVESVLRQSFTEEKTETKDPTAVSWSVGDVLTGMEASTPNPPPECEHGHILKEGVSKTTNRPFYGYVCKERIKEHAVWAKLTAAGSWYFEGGE